jgi:DNA repair exonuclease SbcCD nuclease subunit
MSYIEEICLGNKVDRIVFLGDQHHHHGVMHVKVVKFWTDAIQRLSKLAEVVLMVGNHDLANSGDHEEHSLISYSRIPNCRIVDNPTVLDGILMVPYQHDPEAFVKICQAHDERVVVCHQTFDGSQYENGFYAQDGIDPEDVKQLYIISGHIHSPQEFGKVWYPGSPRWQNRNDANISRAVWILDLDAPKLQRHGFSTDAVCSRILHIEDTEQAPVRYEDVRPLDRRTIAVKGTSQYVEKRFLELKEMFPQAKIQMFADRKVMPQVRESEGIDQAFAKYLDAYQPKAGVDKQQLMRLVESRLSCGT